MATSFKQAVLAVRQSKKLDLQSVPFSCKQEVRREDVLSLTGNHGKQSLLNIAFSATLFLYFQHSSVLLGSTVITADGNEYYKVTAIIYCLQETEYFKKRRTNRQSCRIQKIQCA
jgi:hypothetical protein